MRKIFLICVPKVPVGIRGLKGVARGIAADANAQRINPESLISATKLEQQI